MCHLDVSWGRSEIIQMLGGDGRPRVGGAS